MRRTTWYKTVAAFFLWSAIVMQAAAFYWGGRPLLATAGMLQAAYIGMVYARKVVRHFQTPPETPEHTDSMPSFPSATVEPIPTR